VVLDDIQLQDHILLLIFQENNELPKFRRQLLQLLLQKFGTPIALQKLQH
jgi:hypothetical protein